MNELRLNRSLTLRSDVRRPDAFLGFVADDARSQRISFPSHYQMSVSGLL